MTVLDDVRALSDLIAQVRRSVHEWDTASTPMRDLAAALEAYDAGGDRLAKLTKHLRYLSSAVTTHLEAIDAEMRKPESHERGRRIAQLANDLAFAMLAERAT